VDLSLRSSGTSPFKFRSNAGTKYRAEPHHKFHRTLRPHLVPKDRNQELPRPSGCAKRSPMTQSCFSDDEGGRLGRHLHPTTAGCSPYALDATSPADTPRQAVPQTGDLVVSDHPAKVSNQSERVYFSVRLRVRLLRIVVS
jgi:hypothetical protein